MMQHHTKNYEPLYYTVADLQTLISLCLLESFWNTRPSLSSQQGFFRGGSHSSRPCPASARSSSIEAWRQIMSKFLIMLDQQAPKTIKIPGDLPKLWDVSLFYDTSLHLYYFHLLLWQVYKSSTYVSLRFIDTRQEIPSSWSPTCRSQSLHSLPTAWFGNCESTRYSDHFKAQMILALRLYRFSPIRAVSWKH